MLLYHFVLDEYLLFKLISREYLFVGLTIRWLYHLLSNKTYTLKGC